MNDFFSSPEFIVALIGIALFIVPRVIPAVKEALGVTGILTVFLLLCAAITASVGMSISGDTVKLLGSDTHAFLW